MLLSAPRAPWTEYALSTDERGARACRTEHTRVDRAPSDQRTDVQRAHTVIMCDTEVRPRDTRALGGSGDGGAGDDDATHSPPRTSADVNMPRTAMPTSGWYHRSAYVRQREGGIDRRLLRFSVAFTPALVRPVRTMGESPEPGCGRKLAGHLDSKRQIKITHRRSNVLLLALVRPAGLREGRGARSPSFLMFFIRIFPLG